MALVKIIIKFISLAGKSLHRAGLQKILKILIIINSNRFIKFKKNLITYMVKIPSILNSTKPILYETGYKEWPYAYAGSCFPVRWKSNLYVVSAYHCFENHLVAPECTLYPVPTKPEDFFSFCCNLRAKVNEANDLKHYDQILLQVSVEIHSNEQLNSVLALDLSKADSVVSLSSHEIIDVWLRGFLSENSEHEVDYEKRKIRQQAYVTNGYVSSRKSLSDYFHMLKVKTPTPDGMSPNGMSGSAVYGVDRSGNAKLAGTIIEYNSLTKEFLIIDSILLRKFLETENAQ